MSTTSGMNELLDGRDDKVVQWLIEKRNRLSDNLLFERAADIQARIDTLAVMSRKRMLLTAAIHCRCVLILHVPENNADARVLLAVKGNVVGVRALGTLRAEQLARWVGAHMQIAKAAEST